MTKVSFIVPVHNVEKWLARCLDSILGQTFKDWELICVNDGSTDGSGRILHEYADSDRRIIVVDRQNGGVSDARNAGLAVASGQYMVFVDSDDFIHPQTLQIALSVQERSGADIVSWYKDTEFHSKQIIRNVLHLDTLRYRPSSFYRRYDAASVRYDYTDDIFGVATELTSPKGIRRPVKHCYVWCHLIRRSILEDVSFVKDLLFEDFPWWSSVMLRKPSIAYTSLPLYFYCYNQGSIDVGSSRGRKVSAWVRGLEICTDEYSRKADAHQRECWNMNFKWPVIRKHVARFLPSLKPSDPFYADIVQGISRLRKAGVFDDAATADERKSVRAIDSFLSRSACG